jgi:hypothetical protein
MRQYADPKEEEWRRLNICMVLHLQN